MINLKKINQIREGITLRDRPASQYGHLPGPRYGMDDKDDGNTPPTVPKTERDKKLKAALDQAGKTFPKPIAQRPKYPKLKEAKDPREYDYEGDMAKSQLRSIISNAQEIHDMLEDNTNIAEWVQSKITLSADYITTVRDYMNSEVNEGSVGYHTTVAQTAKSMSTKHKHVALAMKAKFKPKTTPYKIPVDEASSPAQQAAIAIDMKKKGIKPSLLTRVKKMNKQNKEKSQAAFSNMFGGGNPASSLSIRKKSTNEEVEPIEEISKDLAKSYLDKTVDPVYGMPKHGMKDRMKGIRQASIRVLKKAGKPKTN